MEVDKLRSSLRRLGIPESDYRVLKLLPLVYVAWADGKMERGKGSVFTLSRCRTTSLAPPAPQCSKAGFPNRRAKSTIAEGLRDVLFLARAQDDMGIDFSELPALLAHAERIARSTGGLLDEPTAVSQDEARLLGDVARELHVDHGLSWGALLKSLA